MHLFGLYESLTWGEISAQLHTFITCITVILTLFQKRIEFELQLYGAAEILPYLDLFCSVLLSF